jgi:glycosyltransferase involved in cell wall biosynthesis
MVSSLWPPVTVGGAEAYAAELARQLTGRGHEVGAVTLGVPGPAVIEEVKARPYRLDAFASQPPIRRAVFHALDVYRLGTRRALQHAIATFRPDVVHTHSVQGLSSAALETPARLGVAHVHTIHDYWLLCQRASLVRRDGTNCVERCRSCRAIAAVRNRVIARHPPGVVIAVSDAVRDEHLLLDWVRSRIRVIHNPADPAPRRRRSPGSSLVLGFLGQVTAAKGVPTLVAAFEQARLANARLVIAGDGALRARVDAEHPPGVEVRGWVDPGGKEAFFEEIDCLVVPSEWRDPAPLVVNEARARGVPVIGARIGGIPELVAPSSRALLHESGNVDELIGRLRAFADAPARFTDDDDPGPMGWPEHLDLVSRAYEDAQKEAAQGARVIVRS